MGMMMQIELIYAIPDNQELIQLEVEQGCTVEQVIQQSGIVSRYPEIVLTEASVGIFSKPVALQQELNPNDRVEIYRPLTIDPKEARRQRAKKKR